MKLVALGAMTTQGEAPMKPSNLLDYMGKCHAELKTFKPLEIDSLRILRVNDEKGVFASVSP